MNFESFGFSDSGKIRDHNEDRYLCSDQERVLMVTQIAHRRIHKVVELNPSSEGMGTTLIKSEQWHAEY
jgi:hypothetical protein